MLDRRFVKYALSAVLFSVTLNNLAQAQNYWVGSGSNQAKLVISWNNGSPGDSYGWGFNWDGTATVADMLKAVALVDDRLFVHAGAPGSFGISVYGIGYDVNDDGTFGTNPALAFVDGWSEGLPDDARLATGTGNIYTEGWLSNGFWGSYDGTSSLTPTWSTNLGISSSTLADDDWKGLSFANTFSFQDPSSSPTWTSAPAGSVPSFQLANDTAEVTYNSSTTEILSWITDGEIKAQIDFDNVTGGTMKATTLNTADVIAEVGSLPDSASVTYGAMMLDDSTSPMTFGTSGDALVSLQLDADFTGNISLLQMYHWDDLLSDWVELTVSGYDAETRLLSTSTPVNSFSPFVIVPEPASLVVLGLGSLAMLRRRARG